MGSRRGARIRFHVKVSAPCSLGPSSRQFVRYALCGGLATAVDGAVFYLCSLTFLPALGPDDPVVRWFQFAGPLAEEAVRSRHFVINRALAFLFSNLTAYVTNVLWVFESGRHHRHVEIALFFVVSGLSLIAGTALGWGLIHLGGLSTTISYLGNIAIAILINYACRKHIVFQG